MRIKERRNKKNKDGRKRKDIGIKERKERMKKNKQKKEKCEKEEERKMIRN